MANLIDRMWDKSKAPSGDFVLNRGSWRAQGLVAWYPMGLMSSVARVFDNAGTNHLANVNGASAQRGTSREQLFGLTRASSQAFDAQNAGAPATVVPITLTAWAICTDITNTQDVFNFSDGGTGHTWRLNFGGNAVGDPIRAIVIGGGGTVAAVTGSGYSSGVLVHAGAVFAAAASRTAYINGVGGSAETTSNTPSSIDTVTIGAVWNASARTNFFQGQVGECAAWNIEQSAENMLALADKGTRFELYYPLRSSKWFLDALAAGGGFVPYPRPRGLEGGLYSMRGGMQ